MFNTSEYAELNATPADDYRCVSAFDGLRLVGSVAGTVRDSEFVSGYSAPFGGFDLIRDPETVGNVDALTTELLRQMERERWSAVRIKCKPSTYSESETLAQFSLLGRGFQVERCELGHNIPLAPLGDLDAYVSALKPPARRALRHSEREPYSFHRVETDEGWTQAYAVLSENRMRKGRSLRLSLDYVLAIRDRFPGRIAMFTLSHGGQVCAAALVYDVSAGHQLVVYWGDAYHDLPRSPMNRLALHVVEQALHNEVENLDLGISSTDGVVDGGLVQFKRSVLGQPYLRLDLLKV